MNKFLSICVFLLLLGSSNLYAQQNTQSNPRLRNFRYGTGQAQWWENKTVSRPSPTRQTFYYPPTVRYYYPAPYYATHFHNCCCHRCAQRRQQMMMLQWQMNPNRLFFFQFRF